MSRGNQPAQSNDQGTTEPTLDGGPIFILSPARAGSTLLRRILDAHPELAAPPEVNLVAAFETIHFGAAAVTSDDTEACAIADALCRQVADQTVGLYTRRTGKRRWCDKSILSLDNPDLLLHIFPDARFICLYRECSDLIVSAMEACPWGYGGAGLQGNYGFEEYVARSPGNFVFALAAYWADKTEAALRFERANSDRCWRVKYEDIVSTPAEVLEGLFVWLDLRTRSSVIDDEKVFDPDALDSPGDYKIRYTSGFDPRSIGRGWTVPIELIHPGLEERINRLCVQLGYSELRGDVHEFSTFRLNGSRRAPRSEASVDELFDRFRDGLNSRRSLARRNGSRGKQGMGPLKLVLTAATEGWMIDLDACEIMRGDQAAECTILTDAETILSVADGTCNPGVALRNGTMKVMSPSMTWDQTQQRIADLLSLLESR